MTGVDFEEGGASGERFAFSGTLNYLIRKNFKLGLGARYANSELFSDNRIVENIDYKASLGYDLNKDVGVAVDLIREERISTKFLDSNNRNIVQGSIIAKF